MASSDGCEHLCRWPSRAAQTCILQLQFWLRWEGVWIQDRIGDTENRMSMLTGCWETEVRAGEDLWCWGWVLGTGESLSPLKFSSDHLFPDSPGLLCSHNTPMQVITSLPTLPETSTCPAGAPPAFFPPTVCPFGVLEAKPVS